MYIEDKVLNWYNTLYSVERQRYPALQNGAFEKVACNERAGTAFSD